MKTRKLFRLFWKENYFTQKKTVDLKEEIVFKTQAQEQWLKIYKSFLLCKVEKSLF